MKAQLPVLLAYFNRPVILRQNLQALAKIRPSSLFLASDGARQGHEGDRRNLELCHEAIAELVTWDCEIRTLRSPANHGVDKWLPKAIEWFFSEVEEGIILEDDCVISQSFVNFASALIERYRDVPRVMNISAPNFHSQRWGQGDYYFSRYPSSWGWATWRRAWAQFDPAISGLDDFLANGLAGMTAAGAERRYWRRFFLGLKSGRYSYWDAKWVYSIWRADGVSITPNVNLVSNIGHGADATHTRTKEAGMDMIIDSLSSPLRAPEAELEVCSAADQFLFVSRYKPTFGRRLAALRNRMPF